MLKNIPQSKRDRLQRTLTSETRDSTQMSRTTFRGISNEADSLLLPCQAHSYYDDRQNSQHSVDVVAQINSSSSHQHLHSYNRRSFSRLAFKRKRGARKERLVKPFCRRRRLSSSGKQATYSPTFIHVRASVYSYQIDNGVPIKLPEFPQEIMI